MAIVCYPLVCFRPQSARWVLHVCSRLILFVLKHVAGLSYKTFGREHLSATPALYVAQHQSMWETVVLFREIPGSIFIVKKSLLAIPFVGRYFREYGLIGIDRSNKSILKKLITQAKASFDKGASIILFPEGRRVAYGHVGRLNPSFTLLAQELQCAVIPVTHNSGKFWTRQSFYKYPGQINLFFHPPLSDFQDREASLLALQDLFSQEKMPEVR